MRLLYGTAQVATPGTEVQLLNSTLKVAGYQLIARKSNSGTVYIGGSSTIDASILSVASSYGLALTPGDVTEFSIGPFMFDARDLWVDAATANDQLDWVLAVEH